MKYDRLLKQAEAAEATGLIDYGADLLQWEKEIMAGRFLTVAELDSIIKYYQAPVDNTKAQAEAREKKAAALGQKSISDREALALRRVPWNKSARLILNNDRAALLSVIRWRINQAAQAQAEKARKAAQAAPDAMPDHYAAALALNYNKAAEAQEKAEAEADPEKRAFLMVKAAQARKAAEALDDRINQIMREKAAEAEAAELEKAEAEEIKAEEKAAAYKDKIGRRRAAALARLRKKYR